MTKYIKFTSKLDDRWAIWEYVEDFSKERCVLSSDKEFTARNKYWNSITRIVKNRIQYKNIQSYKHITKDEVFLEIL